MVKLVSIPTCRNVLGGLLAMPLLICKRRVGERRVGERRVGLSV